MSAGVMQSIKRQVARSAWAMVNSRRWVRLRDGAVVKWDMSSPHPNPAMDSARMWTAWHPDPSQEALTMSRGFVRMANGHAWKPRFPRRWKTAEAAMRAVDREYR